MLNILLRWKNWAELRPIFRVSKLRDGSQVFRKLMLTYGFGQFASHFGSLCTIRLLQWVEFGGWSWSWRSCPLSNLVAHLFSLPSFLCLVSFQTSDSDFSSLVRSAMPPIPASRARKMNLFLSVTATLAGSSFLYVFHSVSFHLTRGYDLYFWLR